MISPLYFNVMEKLWKQVKDCLRLVVGVIVYILAESRVVQSVV